MHQQDVSSEPAGVHISAAGCTDKGRVREQNEDTIGLFEPPDQFQESQLGSLYLLADGAGGHAAGEVASQIAVETIADVYYHQTSSTGEIRQTQEILTYLDGPLPDLDLAMRQLQRAFLAAHARILALAALTSEYSGMVTTCLATVVKDTQILISHIGDSRAYLIHPSSELFPSLTQLTSDHSLAAAMIQAGILSIQQAQHSPTRHIILRALGNGGQNYVGPDITTCKAHVGDSLILCCDGLWSMLPGELIARVVVSHTPQAACNELIRLANEAGGEDNISAVVLSFTEDARMLKGR